jgi:integrase
LREIFHVLAEKAGLVDDPWEGVRLHADDCHSRRELTLDELERLLRAATKAGNEWRRLFVVGIYTGLRLGDCCCLRWDSVNLERGVIQLIPTKTRKHAHGQPITIPIHPQLMDELRGKREEGKGKREEGKVEVRDGTFVSPTLADWYKNSKWRISHGLELIFKAAHIETSIRIEGRRTRTPEATFHSLRHTFVSLAANAGVPLPVVASIVGHSSTAMTRHYYHENEEMLRQAVAAIPSLDDLKGGRGTCKLSVGLPPPQSAQTIEQRLRQLEKLRRKSLVSEEEYNSTRRRILAEI